MALIHPDRRFSVAPMMDLTDRHFRYFFRLLCGQGLLYSEMVTAPAVLHGDPDRLLGFSAQEHPVALQLGGSDPAQLAEAARRGEQFGYDEINLNCGCPSDRVQSGRIGACLMAEPALVRDCLQAMQDAVSVPVTVKCRIGIDKHDSDDELQRFLSVLYEGGCRVFIVHARKAWLQGLSPKENRDVPPLRYESVYALRDCFPDAQILINGGIKTAAGVQTHLRHVDGVMIGREAYYNPWEMRDVLAAVYGADAVRIQTRREWTLAYLDYLIAREAEGVPLSVMVRHLVPLYQGVRGAKQWRRTLSEGTRHATDVRSLVMQALDELDPEAQ
ncbi:tRNA dihydrouridine(20/20a) synthase DusA [Granulosicoccaceae sp. 1_MG-2023]|nr:tRNA dihydrouridine(20/20a) synthase DusA [Granulosicoccaceae sp. 1_MG-2023]